MNMNGLFHRPFVWNVFSLFRGKWVDRIRRNLAWKTKLAISNVGPRDCWLDLFTVSRKRPVVWRLCHRVLEVLFFINYNTNFIYIHQLPCNFVWKIDVYLHTSTTIRVLSVYFLQNYNFCIFLRFIHQRSRNKTSPSLSVGKCLRTYFVRFSRENVKRNNAVMNGK